MRKRHFNSFFNPSFAQSVFLSGSNCCPLLCNSRLTSFCAFCNTVQIMSFVDRKIWSFKIHMALNIVAYVCIVLIISSASVEGRKKKPKCSVCEEIVNNFKKGLESTAKSNYGGGNTNWEENSLGSYATSEVRLVEIVEKLCDGASKECHSMLEEHEENLERYWFKEFGKKKDTDLYGYLCIEHIKACCPKNTYGPECSACPGEEARPCTGNGKCDGSGTREGTGKCNCDSGYKGDLCNECKDGFFEESKNDTHTSCKVCHISCKKMCWEDGPKGCDECKDGWTANEELGCQDVNECADEPCEENKYCFNTQGSYSCFSCDRACASCTESGPGNCKVCASGYLLNEENKMCTDVNECENDPSLCNGENQVCNNEPGSYKCACVDGFELKDDTCQPVPKEDSEEIEVEATLNASDESNSESPQPEADKDQTSEDKEEL